MVVELVPLKGGIDGIVHPPISSIYHLYTTYILPSGELYATLPPFRGTRNNDIMLSGTWPFDSV